MLPSSGPSKYSLLPESSKVYVGPDDVVAHWPVNGYEEKSLTTVNSYLEPDGGYIFCHSPNKEGGVYSVGNGVYVMGRIRVRGQYVNQLFQPFGHDNQDLSTIQEFNELCNRTFPACKGQGWAVAGAGGWFDFHADPFDPSDNALNISIPDVLPEVVDLRQWCSPVRNQGAINSCTANAAVALVEYFERRSAGRFIEASRLFLYKVTRNLGQKTGDVGANTRSTMKALALIGVPPEEYWPYVEADVDSEPSAFCYAIADRYRATEYFRLDTRDRAKEDVLQYAKACLASNRPLMFGIMAYAGCWKQSLSSGKFPFPAAGDTRFGGHNMAVVGYDDHMEITNTDENGPVSTGAFLVKNSFGDQWGEQGYGWVPYDYLLKHQSIDWWTISKQEWLDTGNFDS